ncbi:hypothetical protein FOZ63_021701 [Perkinsus olseni]|uniref:Uncharacterized protein n=2 Tax=Perkinsus olseni TaxID=32597 RepID=A0A7J6PR91_PEROL|nr:hypothetical protein FOZ63_021701 [Perkinsus olseni]
MMAYVAGHISALFIVLVGAGSWSSTSLDPEDAFESWVDFWFRSQADGNVLISTIITICFVIACGTASSLTLWLHLHFDNHLSPVVASALVSLAAGLFLPPSTNPLMFFIWTGSFVGMSGPAASPGAYSIITVKDSPVLSDITSIFLTGLWAGILLISFWWWTGEIGGRYGFIAFVACITVHLLTKMFRKKRPEAEESGDDTDDTRKENADSEVQAESRPAVTTTEFETICYRSALLPLTAPDRPSLVFAIFVLYSVSKRLSCYPSSGRLSGGSIGYSTPTLKHLGMSDAMVSFTWLAGPLSGMLVQPVVGVLSDRVGRRRKPFLCAGLLGMLIGLLAFSNASSPLAAIVSFWFLDISINAYQGPLRALLVDTVPERLQANANAALGVTAGFSTALGYLFGGIDFTSSAGALSSEVSAVFAITAVYVGVFGLLAICCVPEDKTTTTSSVVAENCGKRLCREATDGIRVMPFSMRVAFAAQSSSYLAWFAIYMYTTEWVGVTIFGGSEEGDASTEEKLLFTQGVRHANISLAIAALLCGLTSMALPTLLKRVSLPRLWSFSIFSLSVNMAVAALFVTSPAASRLSIALLGIPMAATHLLPWTLVSQISSRPHLADHRARVTAVFNLSQCYPEMTMSALAAVIFSIPGGSIPIVLLVGSISALVSSVLAWMAVDEDPTTAAESNSKYDYVIEEDVDLEMSTTDDDGGPPQPAAFGVFNDE